MNLAHNDAHLLRLRRPGASLLSPSPMGIGPPSAATQRSRRTIRSGRPPPNQRMADTLDEAKAALKKRYEEMKRGK